MCIQRSESTIRTSCTTEELIHFGTSQKGGQIQTYQKAAVRGTETTTVVTSASKELHVIEMISVLNKVLMPVTGELQKLGIVNNTVGAEPEDSRPRRASREEQVNLGMEQSPGYEGKNYAIAFESNSEVKRKLDPARG